MPGPTKQFHSAIELSQSNSVARKAPVCLACHQGRAQINQAQWNLRHSCNVKRMILDYGDAKLSNKLSGNVLSVANMKARCTDLSHVQTFQAKEFLKTHLSPTSVLTSPDRCLLTTGISPREQTRYKAAA